MLFMESLIPAGSTELVSAYARAGVDVEAGYRSVELMKEHVRSTFTKNVLTDIGGFGGLFALGDLPKDPVLVSGTDGVGTKLKLAFLQDKHDTVGVDCVAMCVNDIICCGARPLFFLDYIACGRNVPEKIAELVSGVADGCRQSKAALIGGETAEMPGFYPENEYDLAGFAVGIVGRGDIIDGKRAEVGDALIGFASTGPHSNGYSLIRKLFSENELRDLPELLVPTRIYVNAVDALRQAVDVRALAHVTGGGFIENLPRMLPRHLGLDIDGQWDAPPIFEEIRRRGNISRRDMFNTFNMGIGMAAIVPESQVQTAIAALKAADVPAWRIGRVTDTPGVQL
ncbi:phosphoribosylformylglycinamidine cyclo-ligase [Clostridia bacterium]|nr:phosphoribosylformylglycinamidine cyclo-ligase [Clostridia bacterium]